MIGFRIVDRVLVWSHTHKHTYARTHTPTVTVLSMLNGYVLELGQRQKTLSLQDLTPRVSRADHSVFLG